MDSFNNKGEKTGSITTAFSQDKVVTVNSTTYATTVITRDRNTGKVSQETFLGDSPFGK